MVSSSMQNGISPLDENAPLPNPQSDLVITIFHQKAIGQDSPQLETSADSFHSGLEKIVHTLQLPNLDQIWNQRIYTKPNPQTTRLRLYIPQSQAQNLNLPSFRHHPSVTAFERTHTVEIIFDLFPSPTTTPTTPLTQPPPLRPLRLALFDMDSTLINQEIIDELARSINILPAVSAITSRAMNGEIDFATSLTQRVGMLKGVPISVWEDLKRTVTIAEGARELVKGLKARGVVTGVVSGGFVPMAEWLRGELGLDVAVANHLVEVGATEEFPFEHLVGELDPGFPIVTPELKRDVLVRLATERGIPLSETLAVGDGSNDLLMLGAAGLGIAWRAKEKVQRVAPMRLNGKSLDELLVLFGEDGDVAEG